MKDFWGSGFTTGLLVWEAGQADGLEDRLGMGRGLLGKDPGLLILQLQGDHACRALRGQGDLQRTAQQQGKMGDKEAPVEMPSRLDRAVELMRRYRNLSMDLADATLVVLAEKRGL